MSFLSKSGKEHHRPLSWTDSTGNVYNYYKKPLTKACIYILVQECCERLAFYGMMPNLMLFLKEQLNIESSEASALVSIFNALIYFTPILSAIIADTWLGAYMTILAFSSVYMAGLVLICIAGATQSAWATYLSVFVLIALGAGGIKSCVSVMGASQFHPTEHVKDITRFFTFFYAAINAGAIVGGITVPLTQQVSGEFWYGYLIPVGAFGIATFVFVIGSPRYVKMLPQGSQVVQVLKVIWASISGFQGLNKCKMSNGGKFQDSFIEDTVSLMYLIPLFALAIPFNVCYYQMSTAFFSQGLKMHSTFFGLPMDAALIQNVDPIAVILGCILIEYILYTQLRKYNMMPSVLVRFFLGCMCGTASLICAMCVEFAIMASANPQESLSIWLQIPQFALIAFGEIFMISTTYEVAFTYSPEPLKAVGSALNLALIGTAAFISAAMFKICAGWMPEYKAEEPPTWQDSHFDYYFALLAGICFVSGLVSLCMNPYFKKHVKKPIERDQEKAAAASANDDKVTATPNESSIEVVQV